MPAKKTEIGPLFSHKNIFIKGGMLFQYTKVWHTQCRSVLESGVEDVCADTWSQPYCFANSCFFGFGCCLSGSGEDSLDRLLPLVNAPRRKSMTLSKTEPPLLRTGTRTIYTAGRPPWYDEHGAQSKEAFVIGMDTIRLFHSCLHNIPHMLSKVIDFCCLVLPYFLLTKVLSHSK